MNRDSHIYTFGRRASRRPVYGRMLALQSLYSSTPKMPIIINANTLIRFVGSSDRW